MATTAKHTCDGCGKHVDNQPRWGAPPDGWLIVQQVKPQVPSVPAARRPALLAHVWPGVYDGWRVATAYIRWCDLLVMVSWRRWPRALGLVWSVSRRGWAPEPRSWMLKW